MLAGNLGLVYSLFYVNARRSRYPATCGEVVIMASAPDRRVRRSIADIQADYDAGKKKELEDLMRAWNGIKQLGSNDFNAFFIIGGFHGEPFRGP